MNSADAFTTCLAAALRAIQHDDRAAFDEITAPDCIYHPARVRPLAGTSITLFRIEGGTIVERWEAIPRGTRGDDIRMRV